MTSKKKYYLLILVVVAALIATLFVYKNKEIKGGYLKWKKRKLKKKVY